MLTGHYLAALGGGLLIGASAALLLLLCGRIAGISGILYGAVSSAATGDRAWRVLFLAGLVGGAALHGATTGVSYYTTDDPSPWLMLVSGLLVGFGTRLGSGCTSGHGVCGLGRLSLRSLVATLLFMVSAAITVYLVRHVAGMSW